MKSYTLNRIRSNINLRYLSDIKKRRDIYIQHTTPSMEDIIRVNGLIGKRWDKWNTYETFPSSHIRSKK